MIAANSFPESLRFQESLSVYVFFPFFCHKIFGLTVALSIDHVLCPTSASPVSARARPVAAPVAGCSSPYLPLCVSFLIESHTFPSSHRLTSFRIVFLLSS